MRITAFAFAIGLVIGPSTTWPQANISTVYRPSSETLRISDAAQAEMVIQRIAKGGDCENRAGLCKIFPASPDLSGFMRYISSATFEADTLVLQREDPEQAPVRLRFDALEGVDVIYKRVWGADLFGVRVSKDLVLWHRPTGKKIEKERMMLFADALYAIRKFKIDEPRLETQFIEEVAKYRAASPKPTITEEMRKYRVQAELMIRDKQFADAARLYGEALKLGPWWPEGRYNRGLVLAELKRYREASQEMKRFLQLEPNAPEARAIQDKMYEWEALAKQAAKAQ